MSRQIIIKDILSLDELQGRVSQLEWELSARYTSTTRRQEWLSWRLFLREELEQNCKIEYTELGAPYIVDSPLFLSVSHTKKSVAIVLSDTTCAIDMELKSRNFAAVKSRYLTAEECDIISAATNPIALAVAWSAKEAAYKYSAEAALDMTRDITIAAIDYTARTIQIGVKSKILNGSFFENDEHVVVVI